MGPFSAVLRRETGGHCVTRTTWAFSEEPPLLPDEVSPEAFL